MSTYDLIFSASRNVSICFRFLNPIQAKESQFLSDVSSNKPHVNYCLKLGYSQSKKTVRYFKEIV